MFWICERGDLNERCVCVHVCMCVVCMCVCVRKIMYMSVFVSEGYQNQYISPFLRVKVILGGTKLGKHKIATQCTISHK
jgi:hypothetical protein